MRSAAIALDDAVGADMATQTSADADRLRRGILRCAQNDGMVGLTYLLTDCVHDCGGEAGARFHVLGLYRGMHAVGEQHHHQVVLRVHPQ